MWPFKKKGKKEEKPKKKGKIFGDPYIEVEQ